MENLEKSPTSWEPGKLMEFNFSQHQIMENSWKIKLVKNDFTSTILRQFCSYDILNKGY